MALRRFVQEGEREGWAVQERDDETASSGICDTASPHRREPGGVGKGGGFWRAAAWACENDLQGTPKHVAQARRQCRDAPCTHVHHPSMLPK